LAALQHHLAVQDDGHGDAGHVELLAHRFDIGVEILQLRRRGGLLRMRAAPQSERQHQRASLPGDQRNPHH